MDGGAWQAAVHGVAEGRTWLSHFTFTFHFHALEKEMAAHSSVLAWRIPGTGESGGLPSVGSHRVGHDWSDLASKQARASRWAAVHGVARSRTRLSDFTLTFHFHALEKERATHSSVLAWRIPGTGELGGLPSMGSHRVRHYWSDLAAAAEPPERLLLCQHHDFNPRDPSWTSDFRIIK